MPTAADQDIDDPFVTLKIRSSTAQRIREIAGLEDRTLEAVVRRAVKAYEKATKR